MTIWWKLLIALVLIAAIAGEQWWVYGKGESAGSAKTEAVWQTREAKINADAANRIAAADKRVADIEHAMQTNLAAVDTHYQTKLKEKDNETDRAIAAAKSSGLWAHITGCTSIAGHTAGSTAASPAGRDDTTLARLSDADAGFLLSEAGRADKIVEQLTACQAVVTADRAH